MPESTIKLTTKVSGISQLEKVDSLLKSIKSSTASMGKVETPSGLSKMESQLTKISAQMHRLESANPTSCPSLLRSPDAISSSS